MSPEELDAVALESRPRLVRLAAKLVPSRVAEDVAQEALAALTRAKDSVPRESAGAYLTEAVRRQAMAAWRGVRETPMDPASAPDLASEDDLEDTLISAQRGAQVRQAIARMPAARRTVVVQVLAEGRSVPEVAREEGIPESTVRARLRDGTEDLRGILVRGRAEEKRRSGGFSSWAVTMALLDLLRRWREVARKMTARTAVLPTVAALGATVLGGALQTFFTAPVERPVPTAARFEVAEVVLAPDPPPTYEVAPSAPTPVREASVNPERPAGPAPFTDSSRKHHDVGARMLRERLAHPQ